MSLVDEFSCVDCWGCLRWLEDYLCIFRGCGEDVFVWCGKWFESLYDGSGFKFVVSRWSGVGYRVGVGYKYKIRCCFGIVFFFEGYWELLYDWCN